MRIGISKRLRFEVLKRDNFTCQYCGRRAPDVTLEIDHIIPVSSGGENEISNLNTACFECNRGKHVVDIPEEDADFDAEYLDFKFWEVGGFGAYCLTKKASGKFRIYLKDFSYEEIEAVLLLTKDISNPTLRFIRVCFELEKLKLFKGFES